MAETKTKKKKAGRSRGTAGSRRPIRHYCQGIGDCHLLRFSGIGGKDFWMLIDCGVHPSVSGGSEMIDRVAADIAAQTKRLDVLVLTHEHMDHISGFMSAAEVFRQLSVGEVWMGWTEDPGDAQARELDKFKDHALAALQMTSRSLDGAVGISPHLDSVRAGVDALLGFSFGAKGERVRAAREAAVALGAGRVRYWEPTDPPLTLSELPDLRIYALGPPRDTRLLGVTERSSEMYEAAAAAGWPVAQALVPALAADEPGAPAETDTGAPFSPSVGTDFRRLADSAAIGPAAEVDTAIASFARRHYFGPATDAGQAIRSRRRSAPLPEEFDQAWRRIDLDWLGVSADLAMQLDARTNNTCLVLAFEFADTGRVMLFAADAQIGSWLSWQDTNWSVGGREVTGPDLLARTVYFKVGHHGSHNATPKEKGLELMQHRDVSAFIPTSERDARKVRWRQMPYGPIIEALGQRCDGRVIRADDPWIAGAEPGPGFQVPAGSIRAVRSEPGLWVEVDVA